MSHLLDADDGLEAKPFLEHLEDFRNMCIRCVLALVAGILICLPFSPYILYWIKAPLNRVISNPDLFLRSIEVAGAFSLTMRIALWSGVLISAPFLLWFIGQFVFPGLLVQERKVIQKALGFAVLLFVVGVAVGYFITLPVALTMMLRMHEWLSIQAEWTVNSYAAFVLHLLIAFGVAFEMPVVLLVLGRMHILSSRDLRSKRRHVIVILFLVAMVLTPPDVFTQVVMALPLILLYEFCVWLLWFWERRAGERAEAVKRDDE